MAETIFDGFGDQRFLGVLRWEVGRIIEVQYARAYGHEPALAPSLECIDYVIFVVLEEVNAGRIGGRIEDFFVRANEVAAKEVKESRYGLN